MQTRPEYVFLADMAQEITPDSVGSRVPPRGGGEPAIPDPRARVRTAGDFRAPDVPPSAVEGSAPAPEEGAQGVAPVSAEPAIAPSVPADPGGAPAVEDVVPVEVTVESLQHQIVEQDRRHHAEMQAMHDNTMRTIDMVSRRGTAPTPPVQEVPEVDPDIDPVGYLSPRIEALTNEVQQLRAANEQGRAAKVSGMVQNHLRDLVQSDPVLKARPNIAGDIVNLVRDELLDTSGVIGQGTTEDNWQDRAKDRLQFHSQRYATELRTTGAPTSRAIKATLANARRVPPVGGDVQTPTPGAPEEPINFADPEARRARSLQLLGRLEQEQA